MLMMMLFSLRWLMPPSAIFDVWLPLRHYYFFAFTLSDSLSLRPAILALKSAPLFFAAAGAIPPA